MSTQTEEATSLYPEHDKLAEVAELSQEIGEFLEFGGYTLCENIAPFDACGYVSWDIDWSGTPLMRCDSGRAINAKGEDIGTCRNCDGTGSIQLSERLMPVTKSTNQILAEWFKIDLKKIEAEKRAMLASLRGESS